MENEISFFDNRIETNRNFNIINYIHNYDRNEPNRNIYNRYELNRNLYNYYEPNRNIYNRNLSNTTPRPSPSLLAILSSFYRDERVLPPLISDDELVLPPLISDERILLPTYVEQELLIPDDAECGITLEKPDCRTSCAHYFCRADITKWLEQQKNEDKKMTCPSCRAEITQVLVAKNK